MFDVGHLVSDPNGDSVPEFVNATLVLGSAPSVAEIGAATEVAARLGFETLGLDLPLRRGVGTSVDGAVRVVVGRAGLAELGLVAPGVDPTSLDAGEGIVTTLQEGGARFVLILGADDDGLRTAARTFAGVLPHTQTLSSAALSETKDDLTRALRRGGFSEDAPRIQIRAARVRSPEPGQALGVGRVIADVYLGTSDQIEPAVQALREVATLTPDSTLSADSLGFDDVGLESVDVRLVGPTPGADAFVRIAGRSAPARPGPVAGRPGRGVKDELDLSTLYSIRGLLGDSDSNLIPDRIDALIVPGSGGLEGLPELGARIGLESTGLVVPLVVPDDHIERPASEATLVLVGREHALTRQIADSGGVDLSTLGAGDGLIELVPAAFGDKPALVVTGGDDAGAARALEHLSQTFPHIAERGRDRAVIEDVEGAVWAALTGDSPVGQAATAVYKLDRIAQSLADQDLAEADVLVSVEKADPSLAVFLQDRSAELADQVRVRVDNRDVQHASVIFEEEHVVEGEVARFRARIAEDLVPAVTPGASVVVRARLSEPPEIRRALESEVRAILIERGSDPDQTTVEILSAFKQGFSWLTDRVLPHLGRLPVHDIVLRFRRNDPPPEWPQQAMHTPVRWLHEIFPVDEVLARDLGVPLERIRFEQTTDGPTYEVVAFDVQGNELFGESFEPRYVLRPYFDRFQDYEHVRVTTGWLLAQVGDRVVVDQRIKTDPEAFWDYFQDTVLTQLYDHVMELHEGLPRGGDQDAPYYGTLEVELELSEPDYRLDIQNEIHAPMDALHEEIYFGTVEFFHLLGRNSRGQDLTFPGRIIPRMRATSSGGDGTARVRITGFATSRPAVVVSYKERSGALGEKRLDIHKVDMERPSARRALVRAGKPGLAHLDLRVRVDTEGDARDSLLVYATKEQVDGRMMSAQQVQSVMGNVEMLRAAGLYTSALAFADLGSIGVWAEWTHEQDPQARRSVTLAANGQPEERQELAQFVEEGWTYSGQRLVQWDTPIPPPEGDRILAEMDRAFDHATVYRSGESYLGKTIWVMDLMSPVNTTHWSYAKATTFKPTVIYSARQHANEVSSTSHVLRHAELLLTEPEQREKLSRVNVVVHPFTNPDGAQLAYDLYRETPDYILHAGYLGSLGQDATAGSSDSLPIYPESHVRNRLWNTWLPDVFLNPHGYPSHQVVQLFSEYTGLVRRGRVTERNWGFNKGWFMPGFGYVDDPEFPRHRDAAFEIRDYITRGINSNPDVVELNRTNYARYRRYGADFDADVFRLPLVDSVLIEMPLKGSSGSGGGGYNSNVTIWSGTTEAPDETAYGPYLELVAKAGLSWDQAIFDYLAEGQHEVKRSGGTFFGGTSLRMVRPRPPEKPGEETKSAADAATSNPGRDPF